MSCLSGQRTYFNPRSPRGGATDYWPGGLTWVGISIHAPHEGERLTPYQPAPPVDIFQSTLPTRGSDRSCSSTVGGIVGFQSTLPTRGSDNAGYLTAPVEFVFQSTLPTRGSDHICRKEAAKDEKFQSTLPTRGSDAKEAEKPVSLAISIHAPHEGERRLQGRGRGDKSDISIHAPHEGERPFHVDAAICIDGDFNPRSPRGGATAEL